MYDNFPTLARGSFGVWVIILQMMLYDIFKDKIYITIDGDYGAETSAIVQAFQTEHGLTADGICGPDETWPRVIKIWWEGL